MRVPKLVWPVCLAASACVSPPAPPGAPPVAPRPAPALPAAPAPPANWIDRPVAPGTWIYRQDADGSIAAFGLPDADPRFTLRCDGAARRVLALRPGTVAARMTLQSTTGARSYDAVPTGLQPPTVAAAILPSDPQLDAMAFSRGRVLVALTGSDDLILPVAPEFARVVEDCRAASAPGEP